MWPPRPSYYFDCRVVNASTFDPRGIWQLRAVRRFGRPGEPAKRSSGDEGQEPKHRAARRSSVPSHGKTGFGLFWLSLFAAALFLLLKKQIPSGTEREQAEDSGHDLGYLFSRSWGGRSLGWAAGLPCRRKKNIYLQCKKQESHCGEASTLNSGKLHKNSFVETSYTLTG